MTSDLSASVLRPSVIKWVGKDFTIHLDFNGRKKDDYGCSKAESGVRQYSRTAQEQKQANFSNESSATYHLEDIIDNKSSFPYSKVKNPERKYVCMICKRSFKWRSHWKSHERIHTGERPFKCKICGKAFTRSDGLQCHKKVHINFTKSYSTKAENPTFNEVVIEDLTVSKQEKVFLCAHCGRTFGSFAGYCRHTDRHKDTDDLKCHICNISFNRPSALKIHNRVHTGLKPYQCNICSKAFSIRGNLKRHLLVHSREKPYNCTYCSTCFNNSSHLTRHIRSKHQKSVVA